MSNLSNLEPKEVFKWFYEINQIPRSSGNEKEVSDYLVKFAKDRNLEVYQDEILNVIIKKPGTAGYENSEAVIIQGHMDMVCVKTDDSNHDFDKDPIEMIIDGDLLRANKTTLGADNGIAVAFGLAVLDSNDIPHPPIELLVTTNEETGMDGAMVLKADHLTGTKLLNIDTEEEGAFYVSCSGGANLDMSFDLEKIAASGNGYEIVVSNLKGGHSGAEIHLQRGNALKITSRLLNRIKNSIVLASFEGGIKHNSIPSYARATFVTDEFDKIEKELNDLINDIKEEYRIEEPNLSIAVNPTSIDETYSKKLSNDIIDFFMILPDGVQYISKDIDGLVQTSLNNAVLSEKEGKLVLTTSVRSAVLSSIREILDVLETISARFGLETREYATYPAWQFESESQLRDTSLRVYKELTGTEAGIASIHAGLECGLLKGLLPNTDMISFGPNIKDAHSPLESVSISSVERVWNFTKKLLEELK